MPDLYLKFMTPEVWDALVLAVIFLGLALAVLRLLKDRAVYAAQQRRRSLLADPSADQTPPSDQPKRP